MPRPSASIAQTSPRNVVRPRMRLTMESSDTESNTSHEAKSGSSVSPFYLTSAEIKSQQKEMYAVAKERSLSPRRCIVYRVDETIPWDFWEKNRAERKIKEGGMISVSFARTWSTTAHAGRLPGRRRPLAHRSVVVAAPLRAPA
ncbi:hypothetical protein AFERRI_30322 [Acidithiobacillus ferrivorans]|uniref:Uncharacterized protein n=1 Tax=Acidithiobacillus ferrivorans TaxID=160808 RepID=A0A060UMY8_9PROT|nr:hypothetical protein AFERRI_30322 [Acidithiobacillus ferrivorans]